MDEATVRLQALDGVWEVGGVDRSRGIAVEGLSATSNDKGNDTARFTLRRDPGAMFPDLTAFTPIEIEIAGVVCWEGFIWETPTVEGEDRQIGVEARGWQYHLDDDVYLRSYVHDRLTDWQDPRGKLTTPLTIWRAAGNVEVGDSGITLSIPQNTPLTTGHALGVTLDLREYDAKRVVVELEQLNSNAFLTLWIRGHDFPSPQASYENTSSGTAPASGFYSATFSNPRRYVTVFMYVTYTGTTGGVDLVFRLKSIRVFRDTTYESGNASVFRASTAVADALTFAPLLSQDTSLIEATSFNLPDFAFTEDRTPREVIDAANAFHKWRARIRPGRRLQFGPTPSVPLLRVGDWEGVEFKDASRNAAADIYNRALVTGQGAGAEAVRVSRFAGEQPGVVTEQISSPGAANPVFAANVTNWSASASVAFIAPGHARWTYQETMGGYLQAIMTGTWKKGVTYQITVTADKTAPVTPLIGQVRVGTSTDAAQADFVAALTVNGRVPNTVFWTPKADVSSGVTLLIGIGQNPDSAPATREINVYSVKTSIVRPSLPDRRGFTRTKNQQISPTINDAVAQQLADVWLQGHVRSPLKGTLTAQGSSVRHYLGDAPLHPAHLLLHTTELVHLSHLEDPDTGRLGREAPIATVSYDHDERQADVALDATRENFEAVVSRLELVSGGSR